MASANSVSTTTSNHSHGLSASASFASKTKTKKKHFVQQKVKVFRASDPVVSVFMWAVNHSINELNNIPVPVMLLPDDFKANSKIKVSNHLFNKENLPSHFKIKEYCPQVFRNLRERFGIDDQDYQVSLTRSPPCSEIDNRGEPLVLTSYDKTLVVKQISSEDVADMHSILSDYHQGSLVSREASEKEKEKELPTLKDMDFLNKSQKVYISEEQRKQFMEQLKRDVEFLVNLKIMDYSLLLGIHDVHLAEQEEEEEEKDDDTVGDGEGFPVVTVGSYGTSPEGIAGYLNSHKPLGPGEFDPYIDVYAFKSVEGASRKEVYFMGLIDILTQYDAKKKAAHAAKTVKHGAGAEISTVHPEQYAKRFLDFVTNIFA